MSTSPENLRARNLRMLGVLAALFLVPLLLAFYMYYATDWRPLKRVNHGALITPIRPLPSVHLPRVSPFGNRRGAGARCRESVADTVVARLHRHGELRRALPPGRSMSCARRAFRSTTT